MGFFSRLFGRKPSPGFKGPSAAEVCEQSLRQVAAFITGAGLSEVGVLFDVDALGGGFYGRAAYKIIFESLDPRRLAGCMVQDGDPVSLAGNLFCICFQSHDPAQAKYLRDTLGAVDAPALLPGTRRFAQPPVAAANGLVLSGVIDPQGRFCVQRSGMVGEEWADGTCWTIFRKL